MSDADAATVSIPDTVAGRSLTCRAAAFPSRVERTGHEGTDASAGRYGKGARYADRQIRTGPRFSRF